MVLAPVATPTLASSGGVVDLGGTLPFVAVPVAALMGFVVWAIKRRDGAGRQGGAS